MRPQERQPSTPAEATPNPAPWWYILFAGSSAWRVMAWLYLLVVASAVGFPHSDWPRPILVVVVLLVNLCWLAINSSVAMRVTVGVPMRPDWAKPVLVAAIACVTVGVGVPAVDHLWEDYPSGTVLIIYSALLALALVLFLVNTIAIAVRSR